MAQWGYTKDNGPETWGEHFPAAKGNRQTPIDILPSWATYDAKLKDKPLSFRYDPAKSKSITNTGASFQVPIDGMASLLEGGPLSHKYQVAQFHMHWGKTSSSGSEHRIDGKMFASEIHIVHWNTDLFSSFGEAAAADNGLCVFGIFVQAGKENTALKKLTDLLPKIQYSGSSTDIEGGFDPASMLPEDTSKYWTYLGSLTTPPCYESVTWVVFKQPIEMSEEQLSALRQLHSERISEEGYIIDNYRPPMPLNNRQVAATFRKFFV